MKKKAWEVERDERIWQNTTFKSSRLCDHYQAKEYQVNRFTFHSASVMKSLLSLSYARSTSEDIRTGSQPVDHQIFFANSIFVNAYLNCVMEMLYLSRNSLDIVEICQEVFRALSCNFVEEY